MVDPTAARPNNSLNKETAILNEEIMWCEQYPSILRPHSDFSGKRTMISQVAGERSASEAISNEEDWR
jgi:hypothetical protein